MSQIVELKYLSPDAFLDLLYRRNTDDDNVEIVNDIHAGVPLYIINDKNPEYWTTFDDEHVVLDSYNAALQVYVPSQSIIAIVKEIPAWDPDSQGDDFVPDIPDHVFSTYIAELTAACFAYYKQGASPVDERRAARGLSRLRKDAEKINERDHRAKYGRPRPQYYVRSEDGIKGSIRDSLSPF